MTKRAAEQGSELVRRLLAFARRQKLEPQAIDLAALQEAVSDLLTHTLGGLVDIEWRRAQDVWHAFADQAQLELALVNLIINARDAMPAGGTVTVAAENRDAQRRPIGRACRPGDYVRPGRVATPGPAFAPTHLEKVMEPFFTTKEVGKGSGLGLSMVYGFAKQSNGAFRLNSDVGDGTVAEFWLPARPDDVAVVEELRFPPAGAAAHAVATADPAGRRSCRSPQRRRRPCSRTSGTRSSRRQTAPRRSKPCKPGDCDYDLMISDYAMPHLSGTDFLREARELCPGVPALIITGYAEAEAISDRPDGVEVLLKPFTPRELEDALHRVCGDCPVAD